MRNGDSGTAVRTAGRARTEWTTADGKPVLVKRSDRRRRTISATWSGETMVVSLPGHLTAAEEREWVPKMIARLEARQSKGQKRLAAGDQELMARALELSRKYLDSRAAPQSIRWVSNQNGRWGSATPANRTIRISDKLAGMPDWVVDYVILHELAHLLEADHGPAFWKLLQPYQDLERAKAFLHGVDYARAKGFANDGGGPGGVPDAD
ncbi:M48 metallopeptidase family protein [Crystallibacter crystallopoietes]|uniref:M48 metallopeptidase family protein n=1 Tax=Crystallibacter crystallopoietes TaxID=37928 RepID=UPI0002A4D8F1|nr:M48 family metallopeptidase [Arthrobacter crystallopoietes]